jgi:hypothetical protein
MPNKYGMTDMVWAWGQLLDHNISLTDAHDSNGLANITVLDANDPFGKDRQSTLLIRVTCQEQEKVATILASK